MLSITRKADYALVAMADLANHHPELVSTRDLARRRRIPGPVLQKILTKLANERLVLSIQGPSGGYKLARPPGRIVLAEVIAAIEGPFRLTACTGSPPCRLKKKCVPKPACSISGSMGKVHSLLEKCLTGVTIEQLAANTVPEVVVLKGGAKGRPRRSATASV